MPTTKHTEQGDDRVESADSSTLRTSQDEQAKGYLESLTDNDFLAELQSALKNARRLTKKPWKVVVTAEDIEICCQDDSKRIKLPKPKALKN